MVEKLTRDRARIRQTVALFTTMRTPVPDPSGRGVAQLPDLTPLRRVPQALNLPQPAVELVPTRENAARDAGRHHSVGPNFERSLPDATHGNCHLLLALGPTIERLTAFAEVIERCGDQIVFGYRPVDSVCVQPVVMSINGAIATQHGIEA